MRVKAKDSAARNPDGISTALAYRCGCKSAATDMEAFIDAYGEQVALALIPRIASDMRKYGDSIFNREYNEMLNTLPLPVLRKKNMSRKEQSELKKKVEAARRLGIEKELTLEEAA